MNELMTAKQVAEKFGVKPSTIRRWAKEKRLPEPIRLSRRSHRWRKEEVDAAIKSWDADDFYSGEKL